MILSPALKAALDACSEFNGLPIPRSHIEAKSKRFIHSHPRQFVMAHMRRHSDLSLPQIARLLGFKDHTTVLHGIKAAWNRWEDDPDFLRLMTPEQPETEGVFVSGKGWRDAA